MNIKKLIRLLLKIPATPFVVTYHLIVLLTCLVVSFFEWLYDASDFNKSISKKIANDQVTGLKKWFTTI
jgi:hypothetical protein